MKFKELEVFIDIRQGVASNYLQARVMQVNGEGMNYGSDLLKPTKLLATASVDTALFKATEKLKGLTERAVFVFAPEFKREPITFTVS